MKKILFICLGSDGTGEAAQGLTIASEVQRLGGNAQCLIGKVSEPIFKRSGVPYQVLSPHFLGLLTDYIRGDDQLKNPDALVICDIFAHNGLFRYANLPWSDLSAAAETIFAVNTWVFSKEARSVEIIDYGEKFVDPWPIENAHLLTPVPFAPYDAPHTFNALPTNESVSKRSASHVRESLGIAHKKLVLFCTAPWQHANFDSPTVLSMSKNIPVALLRAALSIPGLAVVHVGPSRYEKLAELDGYIWLQSLGAQEFAALVAATDVLLTLNLSARTISRALLANVPILFVQNSHELPNELLSEGPSGEWLRLLGPAKPFKMWPLGFSSSFVSIDKNPYSRTLNSCELSDLAHFKRSLAELAFDPVSRSRLQDAQRKYVRDVKQLPSGAEHILSLM